VSRERVEESIHKKVHNGFTIYFWTDTWVGLVPLRDRFRRLFFLLSVNKDTSVAEMFSFGWGDGGEACNALKF